MVRNGMSIYTIIFINYMAWKIGYLVNICWDCCFLYSAIFLIFGYLLHQQGIGGKEQAVQRQGTAGKQGIKRKFRSILDMFHELVHNLGAVTALITDEIWSWCHLPLSILLIQLRYSWFPCSWMSRWPPWRCRGDSQRHSRLQEWLQALACLCLCTQNVTLTT